MLVAIQYTFGSVGIFTVPKLVVSFGPGAAFGALIAFSTITLIMVPFIPEYKNKENKQIDGGSAPNKIMLIPAALSLLALFFFQSSNMGVADYAIELGKDAGFSVDQLSNMLTIANIIAISGALLVYTIGTRFGRAIPIFAGSSIAALFTFFFHWSEIPEIYFLANAVTGITWAFTVPYILGLCATFDDRGQVVVFAGFVSKMGLASGPLVGAIVVGQGNFGLIINLAATGLIACAILAFWPARRSEVTNIDTLQ
jgi:predicted MFS family arabinose efflux permease